MKRFLKKYTSITVLFSMLLCLILSFTGCSLDFLNSDNSKSSVVADGSKKDDNKEDKKGEKESKNNDAKDIQEDGEYTTKEDVALYLHTYNKDSLFRCQ